MHAFAYPITLKRSDVPRVGYVASCRDLPSLYAAGETLSDAFLHAEAALDVVLTTLLIAHVQPPRPSPIRSDEYLAQPSQETMALLMEYFGPLP